MRRLLLPSAALFWGLQFAFLNPALALLLVALYGAGAGEVGAVLAAYNASGFIASLVLPSWADRRGDYLRPLLACGVLTLVLAGALAVATTLPVAVLALVVVGGPAGVGNSLLFAHLRASGASSTTIVNTRAVFSVAWVAGPPLATLLMGAAGERALLVALAVVAVLNTVTTAAMTRPARDRTTGATATPDDHLPLTRGAVAVLVAAFIALQATNAAAVSVMGLFVTERLDLDVLWAGIALGVSAGLEIPALLLVGRLAAVVSQRALILSGCLAGAAYYAAVAFVSGPVVLLALQVLNAWFFAVVAGIGLTLFQRVIPRPGLASGLYTNTRRLGAIVSGAVIALGSTGSSGYAGVFLACAVLTVVALALLMSLSLGRAETAAG